MSDDDRREEFRERVEAMQAVVTEFNEKLAVATTYLMKAGLPVKTMLEMLEEHQARILAAVEPRTARKLLREQIVNFGNIRLAEAEVRPAPTEDVLAVADETGRIHIMKGAGHA